MKRKSVPLVVCLFSQLALSTAWPQGDEPLKPARCVTLSRIERTDIIDDQHIAFYMRNGDIYVNQLARTCSGLERADKFGYRATAGRLCSVDFINVLDDFGVGLTRGATCRLGTFLPSNEEAIAILKGDEEPAEVEVVPIEVEE